MPHIETEYVEVASREGAKLVVEAGDILDVILNKDPRIVNSPYAKHIQVILPTGVTVYFEIIATMIVAGQKLVSD